MNQKITKPAAILLSALFLLILISSCREKITESCPDNITPSNLVGSIEGKVVTTNKNPVNGIEVRSGNSFAYTNSKGEFYLSNVPVGDRVLVNFKSETYTSTQKIIAVKSNRTSYVDAAVIPIGIIQNLNAATGGSVSFSGAKVDFPANSLVDSKGNVFTGTAKVRATWFNPTLDVFCSCFPGEFNGRRTDNSVTMIESFGFVNVEISNGTEKLQLASGSQSTITMPIPSKLQAKAPATIPLWYYDEAKGEWIEEGTAQKVGNNYVGTVKHFSSWNCDQPNSTSYLEGKVVDSNGDPISFAWVHSEGVDYTGASKIYTNDDGTFKIPVKSSSTAKIWATYHIFSSTSQNITTPATGQTQDIGTIVIPVDTMNICIIVGKVVDNGNNPVQNIYVHLKDSTGKVIDYVMTNMDGKFKFFGECGITYTIQVNAYKNDSSSSGVTIDTTCPSQPATVDLGEIKLDIGGTTIIGRLIDSNNTALPDIYIYSSDSYQSNERQNQTDSLGGFSLWVRPNKNITIHFYSKSQQSKKIDTTSVDLGDTLNLGDIVFP